MLRARAQGQFQAIALRAQIAHQWAVAVHTSIGAAHVFFGRAAVVHGEGIKVQGDVLTVQRTEVRRLAFDPHAEHGSVDALGQLKPVWGMGIQALAQRGRRRHSAQMQGAGKESVFTLTLDGIEVVFAQAQQAQVALQDVAVGDARTQREAGSIRALMLMRLRYLPIRARPAWLFKS